MSRLRIHGFSVSIDGFGAGPKQSLENPLGVGGMALHEWVFSTRTFQRMFGNEGGTTFHFVTEGIHAALERAKEAAQGRDVRLGGGVGTIREYLEAKLVDDMHLALAPAALGSGEALFAGLDLPALGYRPKEHVGTAHAMHVVLARE